MHRAGNASRMDLFGNRCTSPCTFTWISPLRDLICMAKVPWIYIYIYILWTKGWINYDCFYGEEIGSIINLYHTLTVRNYILFCVWIRDWHLFIDWNENLDNFALELIQREIPPWDVLTRKWLYWKLWDWVYGIKWIEKWDLSGVLNDTVFH